MKKITDIYIEKEYMKSTRDEDGNRIKIPATGKFHREPELASQGLRFAHYLIDFVIIFALIFVSGFVLAIISPRTLLVVATPFLSIDLGFYRWEYDFFSLGIFIAYYFIAELTMQRTIGKFATGTVVIDAYGNKPPAGRVLGRSFSRLIPFDALSCLAERGWHDRISGTYVVKKSEAEELRKLLRDPNVLRISESDELLD